MSKKTESIYKAISSLEELNEKFADINKSLDNRDLENIQYEQSQQLKELKFWIESLYSFNGKSTSNAKRNSSKENGKKGGRPPKIISQMRIKAKELELVIQELEHHIRLSDENNEIRQYQNDLDTARNELEEVMKVLKNYKK